jgi:hypothetical protein
MGGWLGMAESFFEHPILNSPYAYPGRHWDLDADGQPTNVIAEFRRRSDLITPVPKLKKQRRRKGQIWMVTDFGDGLSIEEQEYNPTPIINKVRGHVDDWWPRDRGFRREIVARTGDARAGDGVSRRFREDRRRGIDLSLNVKSAPWRHSGGRPRRRRKILSIPVVFLRRWRILTPYSFRGRDLNHRRAGRRKSGTSLPAAAEQSAAVKNLYCRSSPYVGEKWKRRYWCR